MLNGKLVLHDVKDAEAFVIMCVKRSGAQAQPDEWEDLVAEGLCLLVAMATKYDPSVNVTEGATFRFSGYALRYLPKKLKEAWHRSHEEHVQRSNKDGKRHWYYYDKPVSWDMVTDNTQEGQGHFDESRVRTAGHFVNPSAPKPTDTRSANQRNSTSTNNGVETNA